MLTSKVLIILLGSITVIHTTGADNSHLPKAIVNYNRNEIPQNSIAYENRTHVMVDVNMFIYSFSSISVVDMDYTIDFLLRQRWLDERLIPIAPARGEKPKPITYMLAKLWTPDLFFRNAKKGFLHKITQPNYLIWLDDRAVITFSQKLSLTVSCHMTLWNFPMDTQLCQVNIGSYGYAKEDLEFRWWVDEEYTAVRQIETNRSANRAIFIRPGLEINEFSLVSYDAYYCAVNYSSTGAFSCLELQFRLKRRFGFYLIYTYLPSILVVIIAWVSFLIDPSSVPARVSLGLLCVLALITQSAAILTQLPRVSYIKAMDIWVFVCLAFVVSSLLEFAAVNTFARVEARAKACPKHSVIDSSNTAIMTSVKILKQLIEVTSKGESKTLNGDTNAMDECTISKQSPARSTDGYVDESQKCLHGEESFAPTKLATLQGISSNETFEPAGWRPTRSVGDSCYCSHLSRSKRLDVTFAVFYPILFALFNLIYWTYYLLYTE